MDTLPEDRLAAEIRALHAEELKREAEVRHTEETLSGLRDIDAVLALAAVKLSLCLRLMKSASRGGAAGEHAALEEQITAKSREALGLVDGLLAANISEDQQGIIQANPAYAQVGARLEEFLLAGGGGFLQARQTDARSRRLLSRTVVAAVDVYPW
jgi:hypothetical protein